MVLLFHSVCLEVLSIMIEVLMSVVKTLIQICIGDILWGYHCRERRIDSQTW